MKNFKIFPVLVILHWNYGCDGKILPCKNSHLSKVCFLVDEAEGYIHTNSPQPLPTMIDITIDILAINEVDEEKQAVELSLKTTLDWQDSRLSVNRTKEEFDT